MDVYLQSKPNRSDDSTGIDMYVECIGDLERDYDNLYDVCERNYSEIEYEDTSTGNNKTTNEICEKSEDINKPVADAIIHMANITIWKKLKELFQQKMFVYVNIFSLLTCWVLSVYVLGLCLFTFSGDYEYFLVVAMFLTIILGMAAWIYFKWSDYHDTETGRKIHAIQNNQSSSNNVENSPGDITMYLDDTNCDNCNGLITESLVNDTVKHVKQDKIISAESFFQAVRDHNFRAIQWLVENEKVDVNSQDENGRTALHIATASNYKQLLNYLIHYTNIKVNIREFKMGETPLHVAAGAGFMSVVIELVENNARVNLQTEKSRYTPLHMAVSNSHFNIVQYLMAKRADVNAASKGGMTVLQIAVTTKNLKIIKLLLEHRKLKINKADQRLFTAFHYACNIGNVKIVKLLIHKKTNINAVTRDGSTGLHIAAAKGFEQIVYILLKNDAKITSDIKGKSPWDVAVQNKYHSIASRIQYKTYNQNIARLFEY